MKTAISVCSGQYPSFLAENGLTLLEVHAPKSFLGVKGGAWVDQGPWWAANCVGDLSLTAKKEKKNLIL